MSKRKAVRRPEGCLCRTGNYCHLHRSYGGYRRGVEAMLEEPENINSFQRAGGGRRLIRKRLGAE